MTIETLQHHLGDLGTKIGIDDLALDENGHCLLRVDEKILLS
jgi:hypothetical protein